MASKKLKPRGMRYRNTTPGPGERVVHNFPCRERRYGEDGWRYWTEPVEDAKGGPRVRCHCDWTSVVPEHYGTVSVITESGEHLPVREIERAS